MKKIEVHYCLFDNPETLRREYWEDGMLLHHTIKEWVTNFYRIDGLRPWSPGRLWGDPGALVQRYASLITEVVSSRTPGRPK